jgi:hypothetical protein
MGIYPAHLDIMWLTDNVSGHYKRATMIGVTLTAANSAGLVVGQIFTTQSKPRYLKGFAVALSEKSLRFYTLIALGLACLSLITVFALIFGMS